MAAREPSVTFLFPFRWLEEDKEFLSENLYRQVLKQIGPESLENCEEIVKYRVIIFYQSNKPQKFTINKTIIQKALKKIFPNAICLSVDTEYMQHKSKTMLPVCDFRIYF